MPERLRRRPGLIETMRLRQGRVPLWDLHRARLERSARALSIVVPDELAPPVGGADRVCRLELGPRGRLYWSERKPGTPEHLRLRTCAVPHRGYRHKSTDRAWLDAARLEAAAAGADDALLVTENGFVAESSVWSVLWWEDGRLCAPPLALGVLPGVARERLAAVAGGITEQELPASNLAARSPFLANAARGVVLISQLDDHTVPAAEVTGRLRDAFWP
jgi:branched-subunit amino acid aminotransferase/4-amino-4-deoxychorismate lyase